MPKFDSNTHQTACQSYVASKCIPKMSWVDISQGCATLFVLDLLGKIPLVAQFLDLMHLGFEPVHVFSLILKKPFEKLA